MRRFGWRGTILLRKVEPDVGETDFHQMIGISHWTAEDSAKLYTDLQEVYHVPGGKERCREQSAGAECTDISC